MFNLFINFRKYEGINTICNNCVNKDGFDSCNSNQIVLSTGYWRRYATSNVILPCPLESASCTGKNDFNIYFLAKYIY
jgi:hypothetical protein